MKYVVMHGSVKMKSHDADGVVGLGQEIELTKEEAKAMDPAGVMLMTVEQAAAHYEAALAAEKLAAAKKKAMDEVDAKFKGKVEERQLVEPGSTLEQKHAAAAKLFMAAQKPAPKAEVKAGAK